MKKSMKLADITSGFGGETDAWGTTYTLLPSHDAITVDYPISTNQITLWGNENNPVFTDPSTEDGNALFGILPRNAKSVVYTHPCTQNLALYVHGQSVASRSYDENAFARTFDYWRVFSFTYTGFRVAGYAA